MMKNFFEESDVDGKKMTVKRTSEQEWERIRTSILDALKPFPAAREAVVAGLLELSAMDEAGPEA